MNETRIEKIAFTFTAVGSLICGGAAITAFFCLLITLASLVMVRPAFPQSATAGVRLQAGIAKEDADGDLKSAMEIYQKIADDRSAPREVRSRALLRLAGCYEKLGQQAQKIYEQLVHDFGDQPAATQARSRLAALRLASGPTLPATMTQRKLPPDIYSDGQRELRLDAATGALTIGDAGREKRVIFKPKAGDRIMWVTPSKDFSMFAMDMAKPDGNFKSALIKADGMGYREIGDGRNSCDFSWSWDNRYVFFCSDDPDGTRYLVKVPVADGEVRKVRVSNAYVFRPSPNGRFIALDTAPYYPRGAGVGKVLVMPNDGGEPQLVSDSAELVDWTRDGRYLIVDSARSGSEALYLIPMQDGRAAGEPIFVRYGPCSYGATHVDGSLVCESSPPGGMLVAWLGALDSNGHVTDWKRLSLCVDPSDLHWLPDSIQITVECRNEAPGQDSYVTRVRNLISGEDHEVYRSSRHTACIGAALRPDLLCVPTNQRADKEVVSIEIASGRVERLGTLPGTESRWPFFTSPDDRTIYFGQDPGDGLVRWDIGARQVTMVERINGWGLPGYTVPLPNDHWIARRNKETTEIRPFAGGEWRPLISLSPTHIAFTPDGNWLLYHDVDAAGKDALFRVSTAGGKPERTGSFPSAGKSPPNMIVSPDGQKILALTMARESWLLQNFEPKQTPAR